MFKLLAFFAILAAAFAAPQPAPQPGAGQRDARGLLATTYSAGIPLAYQAPIAYSNLGYSNLAYSSYPAYASNYYYNAAPAYQYII